MKRPTPSLAQRLYDEMPDMILAILSENEIDPHLYTEKWAEAVGPPYKVAPELLEALKALVAFADSMGYGSPTRLHAKAVIAKVEE